MPHTPQQPQDGEPREDGDGQDRLSIRPKKLDMRSFQPDQKLILRTMLGREPDVDPYTGGLVLPGPDAARPAP